MSAALKELLTEYAAEARPYDVREKALAAGRRRRNARRLAPVVVAVLVLAVVGAVAWPWPPTGDVDPISDLPPAASLSGYPRVIYPRLDAPPLPTDRAVGPGLTLYTTRRTDPGGEWYLVVAGGAQYRLDSMYSPSSTAMLSPDRRWLAMVDPGREPATTTLRDLMAPTSAIGVNGAPVFSPDGRWVVLLPAPAAGSPGTVGLGDLTEPDFPRALRSVDLSAYIGQRVASVMANGDLVLAPVAGGRVLNLSIVDPATGLERRHVRVDLAEHLSPAELAGKVDADRLPALSGSPEPLIFTADGLALYQTTKQYGSGAAPNEVIRYLSKDVLVIDLVTQRVRERWVLPEPRLKPTLLEAGMTDHSETWRLREVLPEGLLLVHSQTQRVLSWELYRPTTGELFLVTDLTKLPTGKT